MKNHFGFNLFIFKGCTFKEVFYRRLITASLSHHGQLEPLFFRGVAAETIASAYFYVILWFLRNICCDDSRIWFLGYFPESAGNKTAKREASFLMEICFSFGKVAN